ncbi:MAG: hypothetical protein AAFR59_14755, partial [Bacteroidota bacterium]
MKQEDKLVEYIKDKLAAEPPVYQDAYWEEAQAQMATWDAEKRRKWPFFWLFSLALIVLGIGAWFLWPTATEIPDTALSSTVIPSDVNGPSLSEGTTLLGDIHPLLPPTAQPRVQYTSQMPLTDFTPPFEELEASGDQQATTPVTKVRESQVSTESTFTTNENVPPFTQLTFPARAISPMPEARFKEDDNLNMPILGQASHNLGAAARMAVFLKGTFALRDVNLNETDRPLLQRQNRVGIGVAIPLRPSGKWNLVTGLEYETLALSNLSLDSAGTVFNFSSQTTQIKWEPQAA